MPPVRIAGKAVGTERNRLDTQTGCGDRSQSRWVCHGAPCSYPVGRAGGNCPAIADPSKADDAALVAAAGAEREGSEQNRRFRRLRGRCNYQRKADRGVSDTPYVSVVDGQCWGSPTFRPYLGALRESDFEVSEVASERQVVPSSSEGNDPVSPFGTTVDELMEDPW